MKRRRARYVREWCWGVSERGSRRTTPLGSQNQQLKRERYVSAPPIFLPRKKTCKITEELSVRSSLPPFPYVKPFANAVNRGTVLPLKIPPSPASTFLTSYFRVHPFEILRVWLASPFLSPTQLARFPQPRIQCSFFKDRGGRTAGFLRRQERRRGGGDRLPRPPSPTRRKSAEREKRPNTTLRRKCSKKQESCAVFFSSHFCSIAW